MDFEKPRQDFERPPAPPPAPIHEAPSGGSKVNGKKIALVLLVIVGFALSAYAGYYYADSKAKDREKELVAEIVSQRAQFNAQIETLEYELQNALDEQ